MGKTKGLGYDTWILVPSKCLVPIHDTSRYTYIDMYISFFIHYIHWYIYIMTYVCICIFPISVPKRATRPWL